MVYGVVGKKYHNLSHATCVYMRKKLTTKEQTDYINSRIDLINQKKQLIINQEKQTLHIVIPYDKMQYDKGYFLISGTLNGAPYVGVLCFDKNSAQLHDVLHSGGTIRINSAGQEENRLLRIIMQIELFSIIYLDCSDYFEKAIL